VTAANLTRDPGPDDIAGARRGLRLNRRTDDELAEIHTRHFGKAAFASQSIVLAVQEEQARRALDRDGPMPPGPREPTTEEMLGRGWRPSYPGQQPPF
jgi:hypothetical protein